jgi:NAD(P)-dependent dehydrogenase (short-subunit alcohol dehydrogenase family)
MADVGTLPVPSARAAHTERQSLKASPPDIVDATLFLAAKESRMMTGQMMAVDGGAVAAR